MSYAIEPHEPPCAGLVRAIAGQVDRLRAGCEGAGEAPEVFVHKARVRIKRIRAALRLLRPALGRKVYVRQNEWWRDAARGLSRARDLSARVEALTAAGPEIEAEIGGAAARRLRWEIDRERRTFDASVAIGDAAGTFGAKLAAHGIGALPRPGRCDRGMLARGLARTYRKARDAMADARDAGAPETLPEALPEAFHEWRKQTRHHALQLRLVRHVFPAVAPRVAAARDLARLLGEARDIDVLAASLPDGRASPVAAVLGRRRRALLDAACLAGAGLFERKPKRWVRSIVDAEAPPEQRSDGGA